MNLHLTTTKKEGTKESKVIFSKNNLEDSSLSKLLKKNQLVQMPIQIKCMRHIRLFPTLG
jgi:hypothetical protein